MHWYAMGLHFHHWNHAHPAIVIDLMDRGRISTIYRHNISLKILLIPSLDDGQHQIRRRRRKTSVDAKWMQQQPSHPRERRHKHWCLQFLCSMASKHGSSLLRVYLYEEAFYLTTIKQPWQWFQQSIRWLLCDNFLHPLPNNGDMRLDR